MQKAHDFYRENHIDKGDERLGLFRGLVERYTITTALYPGSFVHITPSFVIPEVVYVDSDKRAARFFADPTIFELVQKRREYEHEPKIRFHARNFAHPIGEPDTFFDLLISQYSGFVSRECKRYLKFGAHLVVNNSHGDASMAALDPEYELVAVYRRHTDRYTFSVEDLESYMVPKKGARPTRTELERTMRGPAFTRTVAGYVFKRVGRI